MDNKFANQAIEIVQKAIEADNKEDYESALSLYKDSLDRFTLAVKYEKNPTRKKLILERVDGYMKRAEELKDHVKKETSTPASSPSKEEGDEKKEEDEETKKLRGALASSVVSEKPNISWEDVAGLESAKESLK